MTKMKNKTFCPKCLNKMFLIYYDRREPEKGKKSKLEYECGQCEYTMKKER